MLRKILIGLAGLALAVGFLACQSDEDVTGPVNLNEDSGCGVWGFVKDSEGTGIPGVVVICYHDGGYPEIDRHTTGAQGWYQCTNWMRWKYIDDVWIEVWAYKSGVIDERVTVWYDMQSAPVWVSFEAP